MKPMKQSLIALLSWIAGLLGYLASGWIFYRQTIGYADFVAAAYRSFFAYHTAFLLIYLPCFVGLARGLPHMRPRWAFALLGAALCFIPTLFVFGAPFHLRTRYLFSHEARLFYCFFAVSGALAGLGFTYVSTTRNA